MLTYDLDGLGSGHNTCHMNVGGMAFGHQRLIGQFHRRAGGEHRVNNNQRLVIKARTGDILNVNHKVIGLGEVFPVSRHKGVLSTVKAIQEALVERQTGTQ